MKTSYRSFLIALIEHEFNKISGNELYNIIKNLECDDFRFYYYLACSQFSQGDVSQISSAKENIEKAIKLIPNIKYCNGSNVENGQIIYNPENGDYLYDNVNKDCADIYHCYGEILSKLGEMDKVLNSFHKYIYYSNLHMTDYNDKVKVYSFRKFNEHTLADLINKEITVCPSTAMNDPFDSIINLWSTKENQERIRQQDIPVEAYCDAWKSFRIRSFCKDLNANELRGKGIVHPLKNILMWSSYADEHKGFCIKYSLSKVFCDYNNENLNEYRCIKNIKYAKDKIDVVNFELNTDLAFATKYAQWEYENEVRLISFNPNRDNEKEMYYGIPLDVNSMIEEIYFGYRCPESTIKTVKNVFSYYANPPLFYKMNIKDSDVYNIYPDLI